MRLGAKDYIMKGNLSRLCPAIARELEDAKVRNKQKHMEEKLRREEQRFRAFVEHSLDIIVILNLEGIVTYLNPAIERALGYKVEERIGANTLEVIHPDDLEYLADKVGILFTDTNAPVVQFEVRLRHKDGSWRTFEAVGSNLTHNNVVEAVIVNYRDITERKRADEDLKENERQYRFLTEKMSDIVWIADLNLRTNYISPSIKNVLGFSQEERLRQKLDEQLTPHSLSLVLEALSRELALEEQGNADPDRKLKMELEYYHKDGSTRWMELIISGIRNDQGVLTKIYGVSRDITDRKQAEKALRESEELYRTIFETTGTSTILIEEDTTISMANEEFVRNSEYSPDEINGRMKWTEIVHPDDLGRMVEQHRLRRTSQGGALPNYEFRYITKTGNVMDTFLTIKLVPGTKRSIASLMNITERKKAEEKLQQTLESLRKAIGTTIQVLVSAVESRDSYTAGHQSRSANLACAIATEMGLAQEKIEGIRMAGIIHDIGKLSIPAEILSKPTKLTDLEFALIKEHSRSGYEMLKDVESPWPLAEIVYQHHERMNGSGYPRNLKGDEIIIESQILAVADVVEAMASHRPYRPTLGIEAALEEIEKNKGILYDML